ncbi:hypothetical protein G5C60_48745 [Streptomyces sp. HC44]|uniref:Uncharacterized protein n=1 Tax=Streptomyces scabichelini TaxID=2711217 RepID=A0A6G4VN97_9ACTN|nr:hypothetical protein [Streptomyces scabichelini]NGO15270.1 hypothetical protein [Streptomyces scabichelini]
MTVATGGSEFDRRSQHNTGPGTFVGRDVHGGVHNHFEHLSEETKGHLEVIAKTSPKLARLLADTAMHSTHNVQAAELIAITANRFNVADSAELLASAAATLQRIALPDSAQLLSATAHKLEKVLPRLLDAADALNSNPRGRM